MSNQDLSYYPVLNEQYDGEIAKIDWAKNCLVD